MILTGRTGLAALMGVLAIMVSPWPATSFAVLLTALAVAVVIDAGLAASPKAVRFDRFGAASARLGESVDAGLVLRNDGRRRFRGHVRDAWAPSARAQPRVHTVELAPGQTRRIATRLRPVRRGTRRSAGVTARSIGPWDWRDGNVRSRYPGRSGSCRRLYPASTCRRGWPNSATSKASCRP
ncbi:putative lipoprotein [Mycobacterium xenopi 3993]|nr:putative lipoprotein [Mycobacterium xenopi 3993]